MFLEAASWADGSGPEVFLGCTTGSKIRHEAAASSQLTLMVEEVIFGSGNENFQGKQCGFLRPQNTSA